MTRAAIEDRLVDLYHSYEDDTPEGIIRWTIQHLMLEDLLTIADENLSGWTSLEASSIRAQVDLALRQLQAMLSYENR